MNEIDYESIPEPPLRGIFTGRVQGVGFRWTTHRVARGYNVTGTVRNLPDGSVEVLVGGAKAEVCRFLRAVGGAMGAKIKDFTSEQIKEDEVPSDGFRIAR